MPYHWELSLNREELIDLLVNLNLGAGFIRDYAPDSDAAQMVANELKRLNKLIDDRSVIIED